MVVTFKIKSMLYYFEFDIEKDEVKIVEANFYNLKKVCYQSCNGWPIFHYYDQYMVITDSPCYMNKFNFSKPNYIWEGVIDASSVEDAEKTIRKMLE
ncbi:MAG: hypothetical protein QW051_02325, partial [Candidatus Aenigmatarchaeota archaeon]